MGICWQSKTEKAVYMREYRRKKRLKAETLGVAEYELHEERPLTNRSIHYSAKHESYLYKAAHRIKRQFGNRVEIDELVNEAWYKCARYHEDVAGRYGRILTWMFRFAIGRINRVDFDSINVPVFIERDKDEIIGLQSVKVEVRNDYLDERVEEIYDLCSEEEQELLFLRFTVGLTYKQIGEVYNKGFSNMIIKYQALFRRIKKRLNGEATRGLRISLNA